MRHIIFIAILLAGCARPTADLIAEFCTENGYQPGTVAFLDCFDVVARANAAHGAIEVDRSAVLMEQGRRLMELGQPRVLGY